MKAVCSIYLLLLITAGYSQAVNQHYYKVKFEYHLAHEKLKMAEQYADSALMIAINLNNYDSVAAAYELRLTVHEIKKDYQSALIDARMIVANRDSAAQGRRRKVLAEVKFMQQQESQTHAAEVASLRDLIQNLERNKSEGQVSLSIILAALGILLLIVIIVLVRKTLQTRDLIEQSKVESRRLQSFKETLSDLLGSNLKDSLSSFENMNKSLANQLGKMNKEESIEFLKRIQATAAELKFKLSNVVEWIEYQADTNEITPVSIESKELIQKVITRLKGEIDEKRIITDVFMPDGQILFADRKMIETVLDNLVSNAIKHTPEGGAITFFAGRKHGLITVGVKDTGRGMTVEVISKLFTISAARTDQKGRGLGLVLSKELIERNGGRMYVESKVGEGSSFYFSLPEGKL
ncbi:hypothetical protein BH09BAC3_BH09BAC3_12480 [soil metagenome]